MFHYSLQETHKDYVYNQIHKNVQQQPFLWKSEENKNSDNMHAYGISYKYPEG